MGGEGTGHVIRVEVKNYPGTDVDAREVGKAVCNSPLVKTAIAGNDPNVGRIAGAVGSWIGKKGKDVDFGLCNMEMGGETIFKEGRFDLDGEKEDRLSSYIKDCQFSSTSEHPEHDKEVSIIIDFNAGK